MLFDLAEMARRLAAQAADLSLDDPLIVAQSLDSLPLAYEISQLMDIPLDVVSVRRMGAPFNPEYPIGAVAANGGCWMNDVVIDYLGLGPAELKDWIEFQRQELKVEMSWVRRVLPPLSLVDRTVILVNRGMVSGGATLAALREVRRQSPTRVIVAAPIYSPSSIENIRLETDEWVGGECVTDLNLINEWYRGAPVPSYEVLEEVLAMAAQNGRTEIYGHEVTVEYQEVQLRGLLARPNGQKGWVIFAHGSGSSHRSSRNQQVAERLNQEGFGTLLFDLLTPEEAAVRSQVFDVQRLSNRLLMATRWLDDHYNEGDLPIGYFGASTGAAAALIAAAELGKRIFAVVSRGGRPDLADDFLVHVKSPTLLIVGGKDETVMALNKMAMQRMGHCEVMTVAGATHLFEEPGALDQVQDLAADWFSRQLDNYANQRRDWIIASRDQDDSSTRTSL